MTNQERTNFDEMAKTWDDNPQRVMLARGLVKTMAEKVPIRPDMEVMDYGTGTGLVALELSPNVGSVVAADNSQGMLDVLKDKILASGIGNITTAKLDLEIQPPLEELNFDLIVTAMTLHHTAVPDKILSSFYEMLKPGGYAVVVDLDEDGGKFHSDNTGVLHHGFNRNELAAHFKVAGFKDVDIFNAYAIKKPVEGEGEREFTMFMAIGKKKS